MTFELGRSLLQSGAITPEGLARALAVTLEPGMPLARAVVGLGLVSEDDIHEHLARSDPRPALTEVHPRLELLGVLPAGLCNRLAALPVDVDEDGTYVVAVLDPRDAYVAEEVAFHLSGFVRLVRAPYSILREALVNYASTVRSSVPPPERMRGLRRGVIYTPAWGTPADVVARAVAAANEAEPAPPPPPPATSVTASTRRFFGGIHSRATEPPGAAAAAAARLRASGDDEPAIPVHGPNMTLTEIDPPTERARDAPLFPLVASLPRPGAAEDESSLPPFAPDPAATLNRLRAASERDEVLALTLESARAVARRAAIFVARKDAVVGWACSPEFGDEGELRALSLPVGGPTLLSPVLDGGVYLGPLLGSVATALLSVMRTATRDVALVSVRVLGRAAVVIVADELIDTLLATRHLEVVAQVAAEGLTRAVRARARARDV